MELIISPFTDYDCKKMNPFGFLFAIIVFCGSIFIFWRIVIFSFPELYILLSELGLINLPDHLKTKKTSIKFPLKLPVNPINKPPVQRPDKLSFKPPLKRHTQPAVKLTPTTPFGRYELPPSTTPFGRYELPPSTTPFSRYDGLLPPIKN
jgi:hypothetical protein